MASSSIRRIASTQIMVLDGRVIVTATWSVIMVLSVAPQRTDAMSDLVRSCYVGQLPDVEFQSQATQRGCSR